MQYSKMTCGLIVSYNPGEQIIQNSKELIKQVDRVIIVDNDSSNSDSIKHLNVLKALDNTHLLVISNEKNVGIAAALNQGIHWSIQEQYEWLVTFDQDTIVPDGFINSLFKCYDKIQSKQDISLICPIRVDYLPMKGSLIDLNSHRNISSTMTSGSLMKISAVKDIGLFDEDLFIDWVDHDYCMRAKAARYKIVQSINTHLFHDAGQIEQHLFFGKKIPTSNHSALRRYYMSRNRAICYKRYFMVDPTFVINDFLLGIRELLKIVLFEEDKQHKLLMVYVGIKDAIFNRKGNYFDHNI